MSRASWIGRALGGALVARVLDHLAVAQSVVVPWGGSCASSD